MFFKFKKLWFHKYFYSTYLTILTISFFTIFPLLGHEKENLAAII